MKNEIPKEWEEDWNDPSMDIYDTHYIEIEGKKYEPRKVNESGFSRSHLRAARRLAPYLAAATLGFGLKQRQRPNVNIVEEFRLIQQKKSKLSKNNRDWVEAQFHRNFIEVDE